LSENRDAAAKIEVPKELGERLIRGEMTVGEFLGLSPTALYAIANVGYQMLTTGKLEAALTIYKGLVQASPFDSVFHCHLGATLYAMGEHEEAIESYTKALQFNRQNADALAGRGELFLRMNKVTEGLADLKAAIEADPEAKRASTLRARATLGMLKKAAEQQRAEQANAGKPAKAPEAKAAAPAAKAAAPAAKPPPKGDEFKSAPKPGKK
jgi:tetratricopeptide (TPR) repeat protein